MASGTVKWFNSTKGFGGKFLFMGVIGLILASLVNMIWPSGTMSFIISAAGVLIFSGLIAYEPRRSRSSMPRPGAPRWPKRSPSSVRSGSTSPS
jgi:FtsH-binding integral membrane protein